MQKTHTRKIYKKPKGTAEKPRLSIFRSNNHIYAQIIDDSVGRTLFSSSTLDKSCFPNNHVTSNCQASILVGQQIAKKSLSINIKTVIFDRGNKIYHGRIQVLADAARAEGLKF